MSTSPMNFLAALCLAFLRFLANCFRKNNKHDLPMPVTSPIKPQSPVFHPLPNISLSGLFPTSASTTPAVIVHPDRSPSPSTMSDASLEVISIADLSLLPSPWSPIGKTAPSGVWMSPHGLLMKASGPVDDDSALSHDDSDRTATPSKLSSVSLYSSGSAFDAFGISVFVSLDSEADQDTNRDDPTTDQHQLTPPKRRQTLSSISGSNATHSSRAIKCFSTPLTKLEINHLRSTSSISSMAYELRMGLFADGRSISAFENIISLLDQTTPESTPPHNDSIPPVEVI